MKIYQKFNVDTKFLPSNYPTFSEFLIKGITHEIQNNKWTTKLESFCVSKGKFGTEAIEASERQTSNTQTTPQTAANIQTNNNVNITPDAKATPAPDWSKYNKPATPLLKQAVKHQSEYILSKGPFSSNKGLKTPKGYGEVSGYCAGYSFNIAYKIKDYVSSKSTSAIKHNFASSGDANQDSHRKALANLGLYDMYYLGEIKASALKGGYLSRLKWNYGDVLNYYAPGHSGPSNMHTQIYTGDLYLTGINSNGKKDAARNSGWSTSAATNYGANFVYKSSNMVFKVYAFKVKPEYLI
jgi:hypothetical protein